MPSLQVAEGSSPQPCVQISSQNAELELGDPRERNLASESGNAESGTDEKA